MDIYQILNINKNEIDQESAIRIFDELMKYAVEFNQIYEEAMDSYMTNLKCLDYTLIANRQRRHI